MPCVAKAKHNFFFLFMSVLVLPFFAAVSLSFSEEVDLTSARRCYLAASAVIGVRAEISDSVDTSWPFFFPLPSLICVRAYLSHP